LAENVNRFQLDTASTASARQSRGISIVCHHLRKWSPPKAVCY